MADFDALVAALAADVRERSARHLPVVTDAQGAVIANGVHRELDAVHQGRAAHAAEAGAHIACARGCTACCETVVVVYQPEAAAAAEWLARPANAAVRDAFLAAYSSWRARVGDGADRLVEHERRGDTAAAEIVFDELRRRRVPCPFLRDGACSIYEVRPGTCRHTMALDTAEHCVAGPPEAPRPRMLAFAPADQMMAHCNQLLRFAHVRMRPGEPAAPLADAVHRLLTAPAAEPRRIGRNDPCPCGSGSKFKRCCGG